MPTARNVLYAQLVSVLSTSSKESLRDRIFETLEHFRIQHRPGLKTPGDLTAREILLHEILEKCTIVSSSEIPRKLESIFGDYRMQSKDRRSKSKSKEISSSKITEDAIDRLGPASRVISSPVGGGPVQKANARAECPKCHSKGVVLAHSYSGDDYFSCIYCGFQAYKASMETDLDIPLATELLGRRFDERGEIEIDEPENDNP